MRDIDRTQILTGHDLSETREYRYARIRHDKQWAGRGCDWTQIATCIGDAATTLESQEVRCHGCHVTSGSTDHVALKHRDILPTQISHMNVDLHLKYTG